MENTSEIKATWDKFWSKKEGTTEYELELRGLLSKKAAEFEKKKILEAGCGTGRGLVPFLERGCKCYGVDFSKEAIKLAGKHSIRGNKINATFSDARKMPFDDGFFDFVYNSGVIEHFKYPEDFKIIAEMARVSRDRVLIIAPNKLCFWYMFGKILFQIIGKWPYGYECSYTPQRLRKLGELSGLKNITVDGILYYLPSNIGFAKVYPSFLSKYFKLFGTLFSKLGPFRFLFAYAMIMEGTKN